VFEAPRCLRDVLLGALARIERFCHPQPVERARVLMLVAWLHAVIVTRLQYVPDGWSKCYEFNEGDLCSAAQVACSCIDHAFAGGVIREHLPLDALDWQAVACLIGETVRMHILCCSPALEVAPNVCRCTAAELTTKRTFQRSLPWFASSCSAARDVVNPMRFAGEQRLEERSVCRQLCAGKRTGLAAYLCTGRLFEFRQWQRRCSELGERNHCR
jgi:hypothetical protein